MTCLKWLGGTLWLIVIATIVNVIVYEIKTKREIKKGRKR